MKRLFPVLALTSLVCLLSAAAPNKPGSNAPDMHDLSSDWKNVEKAMTEGKPKTAIKLITPIIDKAIKAKEYPFAVKAIAYRVKTQGDIEGYKAEARIKLMETELENAPEELKPILETLIAYWYWGYFQQTRWRFMERTSMGEAAGEDITTWDLDRIFEEIDTRFTKALASKKTLQAIPIESWAQILKKDSATKRDGNEGGVPDSYRPTLYDFIAHEALNFYQSGEQSGSLSIDAFELLAKTPVFGTTEDFLAWKIESTDEDSTLIKAIELIQSLMRDHQKDDDQSAFIDLDLLRLSLGNNEALGPEKSELYKSALERFITQYPGHRISARAIADLAQWHYDNGDRVKAHELAEGGMNKFVNSPGANQCFNLIEKITSHNLNASIERVWNAPWPKIDLSYRNITNIHFKVVSYDWETFIERDGWRLENLSRADRKTLLKKTAVKSWSEDLPATSDYKDRQKLLEAPKDLEPGFYYLISSHDPAFIEKDNVVQCAPFWVSDLSLVMRKHNGNGKIGGLVLDATLGRPIEGATVKSWITDHRKKIQGPTVKTDANGLFEIPGKKRTSYAVMVSHDGQSLSASESYYSSQIHAPKPRTQTLFFTDRSLYRPGQTIRYKGLCIRFNQHADQYGTLPKESVTVRFLDANGKEIEKQTKVANKYGSFNGSFTAPADRATGRMTISISGQRCTGYSQINVEEYKRPKFKVTMEAPKKATRLNDTVNVSGTAMAYTGASIDNSMVSYRVVREVRFPDWWGWYCWWRPPHDGESQEIAYGKTRTEADGTFTISFTAKPDLSVDKESEPTFRYTVYADVTDGTGETRSNQQVVNVGYTALKASMTANDWQEAGSPIDIKVVTETLDGEGQAAQVEIKIHALKEPTHVERARLKDRRHYWHYSEDAKSKPAPDLSDPNSWELGNVVATESVKTLEDGKGSIKTKLKTGMYRVMLTTKDSYGSKVTAMLQIRVLDPGAKHFRIKVPSLVAAPTWSAQPGEDFLALWGSGYDSAQAYIEIEHRGKMLNAFWTDGNSTQATIKQTITEAMRGGFTLHVTQVRQNRAYLTSHKINVPWKNKDLTVKWERIVNKLEPGQKETWTAIIEGPDAQAAAAEMVAGLYDKSLDAFNPHNWMKRISVFRENSTLLYSTFQNTQQSMDHVRGYWDRHNRAVEMNYRHFPHELTAQAILFYWGRGGGGLLKAAAPMDPFAAPSAITALANGALYEGEAAPEAKADKLMSVDAASAPFGGAPPGANTSAPAPDLSKVSARKNLEETAFFFPHLVSSEDGKVRMTFSMPEALTEWKFMAFAHDNKLRSGYLEDSVVTAKDLMVQPNPPRFLRESDELEFTVKISNISAAGQKGSVRLSFSDARTLKNVDAALGITATDKKFDVPAGESRTYSWRLKVPDGMGFLQYTAVASTGKLSDGEEGYLPVLSRRILVTESVPLPIRKAGEKDFVFKKLLSSDNSNSLEHEKLVVQMVSNPSWYAVMALPYLMEYQHECSEQIFNRMYANAVARHIAKSDLKIRRVFNQWKGTKTLASPLEKNQDMKSVMLEETPWLMQGENESAARRRVGVLFDDNRLDSEIARAMRQLENMQLRDGAWPWFSRGPASQYITLYVMTGFGRMRHLGVKDINVDPAIKSLDYLDNWLYHHFHDLRKVAKKTKDPDKYMDEQHIGSTIALYLYGRSFFLKDKDFNPKHKDALDYYLGQAAKYWLNLPRISQGHLALAVHRFGVDKKTPGAIMESLKEFSKLDDEMGMHWADDEYSWWWYRAPIETQALMIEAFDEVAKDPESVEECKVWLLKQKQTQDWKTTKATADAVYALLLRGSDLLASDELVEVKLAGKVVKPKNVEAGTGFYEKRFSRTEVKAEMGNISLKKVDDGVAWGSVHWQYLEDMSKVTPYEGTPLTLQKKLFVKINTKKGKELQPIKGGLKVGDELVTRIVVRVDRDMEYVHLKDQRGSGTEPVNVLSSYKYQDGLRYYESTKDTASHFFIDYLPKGTYVFEYSSRVQHRGEYQSGMASIQSMYAPEFNSHSESFKLTVK